MSSGLVLSGIIFLVLTVMTKVYIDPSAFFGLVMFLVILSGSTTALLQSGVFAVAADFPHEHTGSVMSGQGLAGLAVSLSQILTLLASDPGESADPKSLELSALLYFIVAVLVIIAALVAHIGMQNLEYFRYFMRHGKRKLPSATLAVSDEREPMLAVQASAVSLISDYEQSSYLSIFKEVWPYAIAVGLTFTVTLGIFPGLVGNIESVNTESTSRIYNDMFVSFSFLLFNLGDLIGRWSAGRKVILTARMLLPASLCRLIFFPIFLFCNVILRDAAGNIIENSVPLLIPSDWAYWFLMLVFAITNGYIASACMIIGPEQVRSKADREKAGVIMINSLVIGLFLGSMTSFLLRFILCSCNPFIS